MKSFKQIIEDRKADRKALREKNKQFLIDKGVAEKDVDDVLEIILHIRKSKRKKGLAEFKLDLDMAAQRGKALLKKYTDVINSTTNRKVSYMASDRAGGGDSAEERQGRPSRAGHSMHIPATLIWESNKMKSFKQFNEAAKPKVIRRSKGNFIVFGYDNYYPVGTIDDIVAEESTIQKAVAAIEHHRTTEGGAPEYGEYEHYEILNMKAKKWFDHKGKPFEAAFRPLGTFGSMMVFAYDTRYPSGGASDWHDTVHNFDELDYKVLEDERSRNYEWDADNIVVLDTKNGTWYRYR